MKSDLLKKYKSLKQQHQLVLEILSMQYDAININDLLEVVLEFSSRAKIKVVRSKRELQNIISTLNRNGLVVGKKEYKCERTIIEQISRIAKRKKYFSKIIEAIELNDGSQYYYFWNQSGKDKLVKNIRLNIYSQNIPKLNKAINQGQYYQTDIDIRGIFNAILFEPFDAKWLNSFSDGITLPSILYNIRQGFDKLKPIDEYIDYIRMYKLNTKTALGSEYRNLYVEYLMLKGDFKTAQTIITLDEENYMGVANQGWLDFLQGNNEKALLYFEKALKLFYKQAGSKKVFFSNLHGIFYILALFKSQKPELIQLALKYIDTSKHFLVIYDIALRATEKTLNNQMREVRQILNQRPPVSSLSVLFYNLAKYWAYFEDATFDSSYLRDYYKKAMANDYDWLTYEFGNLLLKEAQDSYSDKDVIRYTSITKRSKTALGGIDSIIELIPKQEVWKRSLTALLRLGSTYNQSQQKVNASRLVWLIDFQNRSVHPKEQKFGKTGKWTKGRNISYQRLNEGQDFMTVQDTRIVRNLDYYSMQNRNAFQLNDKASLELIGHPLLFLQQSPSIACELVKAEPQLMVAKQGNNFELRFSDNLNQTGVQFVKETPTRWKALVVTEDHLRIAETLGSKKLTIPKKAEAELSQVMDALAKVVNVQSAIGKVNANIPVVESNAMIHVHLLPVGDGFQLEMFVTPFGETAPYFKPASGGKVVIADIDNKKTQTVRKIKEERTNALYVLEACPALQEEKDFRKIWTFDTPEACLEVLVELEPLKAEKAIIVEWPKGEKLKIKHQAGFSQFGASIKRENDWFGIKGKLQLDNNKVLDMKRLMEMIEKSPTRFIELEDGHFLALTERFRNQIKKINAFADETKDGYRFHPLAALAMEDFSDDIKELEADAAWKDQLRKIKSAQNIRPRVPKGFQAELRPYQKEGFRWLMRLAKWGVGACLADDMGLGKTVQALAVILQRAKDGPTLVIAPASVRYNWEREALKFAPELNPIQFGKGDRQAVLDGLKPYDILISSYGLLHQESDNFQTVQFSTIVLDEAQAIKNKMSKRSKAAMELKGDFKIITTGTPIENHLGELWNLFRFINPGLLGSSQRFQEKFALPIERYKDDATRESLKKLIQPFILRRRKKDVLDDLPEKTEITLTVELSDEERTFYEALRQRALEKLAEGSVPQQGGGARHLQILAEISRLRQASCHPKLVYPDSTLKSSKMELFGSLVEELIEGGHKALVFSQFVKHLALMEALLTSRGIKYQYLDGSTPQKKRQQRIDAFQGGEGDIFLISLKAGGVGLNLTAADYVIHMDPWWNPAVEDQASDRAHRIGQKRPVTVYRLVSEATIEEKIVKLHAQKRDLADSLLSGNDVAGKLNANQLLGLIKEMQ